MQYLIEKENTINELQQELDLNNNKEHLMSKLDKIVSIEKVEEKEQKLANEKYYKNKSDKAQIKILSLEEKY